MKTYKLLALCAVLTIALVGCIPMPWAQTPTQTTAEQEPNVRAVFEFVNPLPEFPSQMLVYRTLEPSISEQHVRRLLSTLQIDAEIQDADDLLFAHHEAHVVELCTSPHTGYLRYSEDDKLSLQKPAQNLPSEEAAIERAAQLLVDHGLMPDAVPTPRTGYFQYGVIDSQGEWVEQGKSALAVGFAFQVGEYRFIGPGAKAGVVFGENGQVIAASRIWREIEPDRDAPIRPTDQALELFKERWPPEAEPDGQPRADILTTVQIEDVYLAYFAEPGMMPQPEIEPVYVFEGSFVVRSQVDDVGIQDSDRFHIIIPALVDR